MIITILCPLVQRLYCDFGPQGIKLVKQICKKIQEAIGEKLSTFYLFQCESVAVQRGYGPCQAERHKGPKYGLF